MHCINGVICHTTPVLSTFNIFESGSYQATSTPSASFASSFRCLSSAHQPRTTPPPNTSPSSCSLYDVNSHLSFVMKYLRVHFAFSYLRTVLFPHVFAPELVRLYARTYTWSIFIRGTIAFFILRWCKFILPYRLNLWKNIPERFLTYHQIIMLSN